MKLLKIFFPIACILFLFQCDNVLQEEPKDFISQENFYNTAEDAQAALDGTYAAMVDNGSFYTIWFWALITGSGEDVNSRGSQFPISEYQGLDQQNQNRAFNSYNALYSGINRANAVLERVPEIEMDENEKNRILAEAHFLRAFYYSNLVKYWGGIPLRRSETVGLENLGAPRASVDEVWNLVISDLNTAINDLPTERRESGKANTWSAKMLLAEAHLANENWEEAQNIADDVIANSPYQLLEINNPDDFLAIYGPDVATHPEDIFSISHSSNNTNSLPNWLHRPSAPYNQYYAPGGVWAKLPNMNSFLGNWNDDDLRKDFNLYTHVVVDGDSIPLPDSSPVLFKKYQDPESTGGGRGNIPIFRYSEALLMYAEATNELEGGPTPLALERLNSIKRRGYGYNPYSPSPVDYPTGLSQTAFRDAVLLERGYEFLLEGKRWHDILRMGKAEELVEATGKDFATPVSYRFPIPEDEINNNPDIGPDDQNPGY